MKLYILGINETALPFIFLDLNKEGWDTQCFLDFKSLEKSCKKEVPSAILVDWESLKADESSSLQSLILRLPQVDFIALSEKDSAEKVKECLQSGYQDFLLKPTSIDELLYALQKSKRRRELFEQFTDPGILLARAVADISSCTSRTLIRTAALHYLKRMTGSKNSLWVQRTKSEYAILASDQKRGKPQAWKALLSQKDNKNPKGWVLRCRDRSNGAVVLWDFEKIPDLQTRKYAEFLLLTAEMSLGQGLKLEKLKRQTLQDGLTGMGNERYLKLLLEQRLSRPKAFQKPFSLLFLDLDYFKKVNDTHGHLVGSQFLIAIAKTLKNMVRRGDVLFRYGGDEFVIYLENMASVKALEISERIRNQIEKRTFNIEEARLKATLSIGIASYPEHGEEAKVLLQTADDALYLSKKNGRNRVSLPKRVHSRKPNENLPLNV
jgi:diguanylate cyclase (GGDEF)-like protein